MRSATKLADLIYMAIDGHHDSRSRGSLCRNDRNVCLAVS